MKSGETYNITMEGLTFPVTVIKTEMAYGRLLATIRPINGSGEIRVNADRLEQT